MSGWQWLPQIISAAVGAGATHAFKEWSEKRPKLIFFLGHVSAFQLKDENKTLVHTHSIVVVNSGKKLASNVRIGHNYLPDYNIYPPIKHEIERLTDGSCEIVIPVFIPKEQITISYLYFPPITWDRINTYTKSDEGHAKAIKVIPAPALPKWQIWLIGLLSVAGVIALANWAIKIFFP